MARLKDSFQSGDWKAEKHVPVIESPEQVNKGAAVTVSVSVGKEIAHPNTTEHHICWIDLYFVPDGEKFTYHLGRVECAAHGASVNGPNTSTIMTVPNVTLTFKTEKSGTLLASSYCNIHGLWENAKTLTVA